MKKIAAVLLSMLFALSCWAETIKLHVSPEGDDNLNTGALKSPYKTISRAIKELMVIPQIDTVQILLADGEYIENVTISDPYFIEFRFPVYISSINNNPDKCILHNVTGTEKPIISIDYMASLHFEGLSFDPISNNAIAYSNSSGYYYFNNCLFNSKNASGSAAISGNFDNSLNIAHSRFEGGNAIEYTGEGQSSFIIENCQFENASIFVSKASQLLFQNNSCNYTNHLSPIQAENIQYLYFTANRIHSLADEGNTISVRGGEQSFYNNMISTEGQNAIALEMDSYSYLTHNTVFTKNGTALEANMIIDSSPYIDLVNNIFAGENDTLLIANVPYESIEGNDFFSNLDVIQIDGTDYQLVDAGKFSSVSVDPFFVSATDLTPQNIRLDNICLFLPDFWSDINGNERYDGLTDPGAVQFNVIPLSGMKTIGNTSADYLTISDAMRDLEMSGVADTIRFQLFRGTYDEHLFIPPNLYSYSSMPKITITSFDAEADSVLIAPTQGEFTLKLGSNVHLEHLSISAAPEGKQLAVLLPGWTDNSSIASCHFISQNETSANYLIENNLEGSLSNISFSNNLFESGGQPVFKLTGYTELDASIPLEQILIENNIINATEAIDGTTFIDIYNANDVFVKNNNFELSYKGTGTGDFCNASLCSQLYFNNNIIKNHYNDYRLNALISSDISSLYLFSNAIDITGSPVDIDYCGYFYALQNTFKSTSNGTCFNVNSSGDGGEFYNNIFYGPYASFYNTIYNSNYNMYAYTGLETPFIADGLTLTDQQLKNQQDINSLLYIPHFENGSVKPSVYNGPLYNNIGGSIGYYLVEMQFDISQDANGTTRNSITPDIGAYEFTPIPVPEIVLRRDTTICEGDTVAINIDETINTPIQWLRDGKPLSPFDTLNSFNATTGGTYHAELQWGNNIISSTSFTLTVNPKPTITVDDTVKVCSTDSLTLNAGSSAAYVWTIEGSQDVISNGVPFLPSVSGNYIVNAYNDNQCNATDTVVVEIGNPFAANIIYENIACGTDSTTISVNPVDVGLFTYDWSVDSLDGDQVIDVTEGSYMLTITDGYCSLSDTIEIIKEGPPVLTVYAELEELSSDQPVTVYIEDSLSICSGETVHLLAETDASVVAWSADPVTVIQDGLTANLAPETATTYKIIAAKGQCQVVDTFFVSVNYKPEVLTADTAMVFCVGEYAEFIAEATGAEYYEWYIQDSLVSTTSKISTDSISFDDAGFYRFIAGNACGADTASSILDLSVYSIPTPFAGPDTTICEGDSIQLSATGGDEYIWYFGNDVFKWASPDDILFFTPDSSSAINLKAINGGRCYAYDTLNISLAPLPSIQFSDTITLIIGETAEIGADKHYSSYYWNTQATDSSIVVNQGGYYYLTVTDELGCKNKDSVFVKEVSGWKPIVNIIKDSLLIGKNRSFTFSTNTNVSIEWRSGSSVAHVDQNGRVTALADGTTYVYAENNEYGITDSVKIIVPADYIPVAMIVLPATKGVYVGDEFTFSSTILPADASQTEIRWHSTDTTVATVDQSGKVYARSAGVCNIVATPLDSYEPAICVLGVSETAIKPIALHLEDSLTLLPTETYRLGAYVEPLSAQSVSIIYASLNPDIATVSANGVVTALKEGMAQIIANVKNSALTAKTYVRVENNRAPKLLKPLQLTLAKDLGSSHISLSEYFADDFTSFSNLQFSFTAPEEITLKQTGAVLQITDNSGSYVGGITINVTVTDSLGKSSSYDLGIELSDKKNIAPSIHISKLFAKEMSDSTSVTLKNIVGDDYTLPENISWQMSSDDSLSVKIVNGKLIVKSKYPDSYITDTVQLSATDEHGKTITKAIVFTNIPHANEAPFILPIAEQEEINGGYIPVILNNYAIDDYTPANELIWNIIPSDKIRALIKNNTLYLSVADKFWYGSVPLTLIAMDEEGKTALTEIVISRKSSTMDYWNGNPLISIQASKLLTTPVSSVNFFADMRGVDSWQWEFEGGEPAVSHDLVPNVYFPEKGSYSVKLKTLNYEGDSVYERTISLDGEIRVVGIEPRHLRLCQNDDSVKLSVETGLNQLIWSNGSTSDSIKVKPLNSQYFAIEFMYGYQKVTDSILVERANVATLGADTAICANSPITLNPGEFFAYSWSNGSTEQTLSISESGSYSVAVMDEYLCTSSDTITITGILDLPQPSLGENDSLCAGVELTLDAGEFAEYRWNNGSTNQTLTADTTGVYSVTVTNEEGCQNTDSISIWYQYPYAEQLGIATFSDNGSAIVLAWERSMNKMTEKYELWRESGGVNQYTKIAERAFKDSLYYIDTDANSVQQSYKYKLVTIDSVCGNKAESMPHRTIHLSQNRGLRNDMVNLSWTSYEGIDVKEYIIYKYENNDTAEIGRVIPGSGNVFSYSFHEEGTKYRVGFELDHEIRLSKLKTDSGPFSHSISNIAEIELTNISEESLGLVMFPVPVLDQLNINLKHADECTIEIYSQSSQLNITQTIIQKGTIDMSGLVAGIYTVRIITEQGVISKLITKK